MYGLPPDVDLAFFRGARVDSVCLGPNQMILRFSGGIVLNSACRTTIEADGDVVSSDMPRDLAGNAGKLISDVVAQVEWDVLGRLRLVFVSGAVVVLEDSGAPGYESYEIEHDGDVIIV